METLNYIVHNILYTLVLVYNLYYLYGSWIRVQGHKNIGNNKILFSFMYT